MTFAGVTGATVLAAALLAAAVLLWPTGRQGPRSGPDRVRSGMPGARGPAGVTGGTARAGEEPLWVRLWRWLQRDLHRRRRRQAWVADFAELSAVGLDAGLPSAEAAQLACSVGGSDSETHLLGDRLRAAAAAGEGVGECLAAYARQPRSAVPQSPDGRGGEPGRPGVEGRSDLAFLATAWQLTDEFGVAAAPAARVAAQVLRERAAAQQRRAVLAAGPRASMWLLTLLPLSGPVVTVLLGLPVGGVYGGVAATAAAAAGLLLTVAGWLWSRTLLRRAVRPVEIA